MTLRHFYGWQICFSTYCSWYWIIFLNFCPQIATTSRKNRFYVSNLKTQPRTKLPHEPYHWNCIMRPSWSALRALQRQHLNRPLQTDVCKCTLVLWYTQGGGLRRQCAAWLILRIADITCYSGKCITVCGQKFKKIIQYHQQYVLKQICQP